jgi:hypothetical protein
MLLFSLLIPRRSKSIRQTKDETEDIGGAARDIKSFLGPINNFDERSKCESLVVEGKKYSIQPN